MPIEPPKLHSSRRTSFAALLAIVAGCGTLLYAHELESWHAGFKALLRLTLDSDARLVAGAGAVLLGVFLLVVDLAWSVRRRAATNVHCAAIESTARFASATIDALSAQVAVLDGSGVILSVNKAWDELSKNASDHSMVLGAQMGTNYLASCETLGAQGYSGAKELAAAIRSAGVGQDGESCVEYERRPETAGAASKWSLCRVTRFAGNTNIRIVISHEDITSRKAAESAAQEAIRTAAAASQAKTAFLANMSHEIRTPMTAILGYADLLRDPSQTTAERNKCVQVIRRNGEHLLGLINDVLDISKIEADKYDVELTSTDLRQLLADVVALTRVKAIQKGLNFRVIVDGPVPREIRTDPMRLKQVLVNLVGNAVKFTSNGSVQLRVCCQDRVVGSILHVDVIDTGIGMNGEQLAKLFRPFSQADESTTRRFGGTGLGLVISRRFAQLLGGDIVVQSEEGVGTCFSMWVDTGPLGGIRMLPKLGEEDLVSVPVAIPGTSASGGAHGFDGGGTAAPVRFAGRVLLAEDGEDNQQLISHLLRAVGARVTIAPNGRIAAETAVTESFDLILMDMQMPELDGYGATRKLRGGGYTKPIVALTANAMSDDRGKCLAAGCDDYLSKPVRLELLHAVLAKYLTPATATPASAAGATSAHETPSSAAASHGAAEARTGSENDTACGDASRADAGATLRSSLAGNEKLRGVLDRFVGRLPERIADMRRLLDQQDLTHLATTVHQIKGAAGGYGFPQITTVAARAEQTIKRAEAIETIGQQVNELIAIIQRVEGFPNSIVAEPTVSAGEPSVAAPAPAQRDVANGSDPSGACDPDSTVATAAGAAAAGPSEFRSARTQIDSVTGLPARNRLLERLSSEIAIARREGQSLACVAVFLPTLADIRSSLGEEVARNLLTRVAATIGSKVSRDCSVYRSDDAHLLVVAPGYGDSGREIDLALALDEALANERFDDLLGTMTGKIMVGCACGVRLTLRIASAADLLALATSAVEAVASAKREGGGRDAAPAGGTGGISARENPQQALAAQANKSRRSSLFLPSADRPGR